MGLNACAAQAPDGPDLENPKKCRSLKCIFQDIPDALSFDMVIKGATCSPCTLREFMDYLLYVEHAAENLQFYLWFDDYSRRFKAIPESQKILSPKWTERSPYTSKRKPSPSREHQRQVMMSTFPDTLPLVEYPSSVRRDADHQQTSVPNTPTSTLSFRIDEEWKNLQPTKSPAPSGSVDYFHPYSAQPFRKEIARITAIYIAEGSPRELNLTDEERCMVLRALETTTHPSAFSQVADGIEWFLRHQSHPHFVKWSIGNSNPTRCLMVRSVSVILALAGIAAGILPILSGAHRAWRVLSIVGLFPGLAVLIAGWDGSCLAFLCFNRRQLHPWEFFTDADGADLGKSGPGGKAFNTYGDSNTYESEPWVPKYAKRTFMERAFDPSEKVKDPVIRRMHTALLTRALIISFLFSAILVAVMVAVPSGNFF